MNRLLFDQNKWVFVLPVALSIALVMLMMLLSPRAIEKVIEEETVVMRVIQVPVSDVVPRALGYGTAEPKRVWSAISRVKGFVSNISPKLRAGAFIKEGDLLVKIDPVEYEIDIEKLKADIAKSDAALAELESYKANDLLSLKIEEDTLRISERELKRSEKLLKQNLHSQAKVDITRRSTLKQQQSVQLLKNSLRLIPSKRHSLEASLAASRARLSAAELNLSYTEIKAPFNARIGQVNLQIGQFLAAGQSLFEVYSSNAIEVEAQVSFANFHHLLTPEQAQVVRSGIDSKTNDAPTAKFLEAIVWQKIGENSWDWNGYLLGVREAVDGRTRSYGVIVAVDDPYGQDGMEQRPPLIKGSFCEVEFRGATLTDQVLVPISAVHEGTVYVVDVQNRLQQREVKIRFQQSGFAVIEFGLTKGETLVVSNPAPAIVGLLVEPVIDEALTKQLISEALAEVPLR